MTELDQLLARAEHLRAHDPEGAELTEVVNAINVIRAAEAPDAFEAWRQRMEGHAELPRVPIVQQAVGARRGRPPRHG